MHPSGDEQASGQGEHWVNVGDHRRAGSEGNGSSSRAHEGLHAIIQVIYGWDLVGEKFNE